MSRPHTATNTPPHKLDEANQAIWHSFEKDENGNLVHVLRTRSIITAGKAMAAVELYAELVRAVEIIKDANLDEGLAGEFETITDAIAKARGEQ